MSHARADDLRVRALRRPKSAIDPWRPLRVELERELDVRGEAAPAATVFLAGAECPFTCVFCDLWRETLDGPTPEGAIPRQLELALAELSGRGCRPAETTLKLYNASNFFDPRAVPPADDAALLRLLAPFPRVVVECHPRLLGERCRRFSRDLAGQLEVAIGLETVHPEALARSGKRATLEDFEGAIRRLREAGAAVRIFALIGAPFIPEEEQVEWTARTVRWALERGAEVVSLIPVRPGNGELERLAVSGEYTPPSLELAELCLERARLEAAAQLGAWRSARGGHAGERPVIQLDPWDLEPLAARAPGGASRLARLHDLNLTVCGAPA